MARSSADQTLLPNEHGHILCEDRNRPVSVLPAGHGSDDYLHNPSVLHQLQAERKLGDEEDNLDHPDTEIMNLLMSQHKHEQEEQLQHSDSQSAPYQCPMQSSDVRMSADNQEATNTKLEPEEDCEDDKNSCSSFHESTADPPQAYYSSLGSEETHSSYEVSTFVTEDGQNSRLIISGNNAYPADIAGSNNIVALGENNITTIALPDGQVLSLGEDALEQIAGLTNLNGGSIQLATTQAADGSTQVQYVLKHDPNIKEEQYNPEQDSPTKKVFQCDVDNCTKQFSTPYRLKAHGRTHTGETFTCVEAGCHKTFVTQSDLLKHTKTHLGQKDFICEVEGCKKEYSTAHHLKVHKRQHSGERPFVCEWEGCGKMFTTGYGLKSHFRTHTNERPYKCQHPNCAKAFKTSGDLQKHVRTHTGERPFHCPYEGCNRSFTTSNIRKVHMRTHTGEKPYRCEIESCGRMFASATNYKNHSRIHTGERPYVCEVPGCMKRFTEYSSLYKHNIVHTQQKPYTCTLCHKTYRQTSTLAMHKRTVHGTDDLTDTERQENGVRLQIKRPRITQSPRLPPVSSASATGYLQGMSLVINNTSSTDSQFTAELSAQHLPESSEIPGAIAIPIQVTMNADGTIAGAQGLNLTDGSGRMIPVNLSVSIPMSTFPQMNNGDTGVDAEQSVDSNIFTQADKMDGVIDMLPESSRQLTTGQSTSNTPSEDGEQHGRLEPRMMSGVGDHLVSSSMDVGLINEQTSSSSSDLIDGVLRDENRHLMRSELPGDNFDVDQDEGDVTDKYLTSHYRKDVKSFPVS